MDEEIGRRSAARFQQGTYIVHDDTPHQQLHCLVVASAVIMLTKFLSTRLFDIRDTIQVKTHAQVILKKYDEGEYIYYELDRHNRGSRRQFRQQQQTMAPSVPILPRVRQRQQAMAPVPVPILSCSYRHDEVDTALAMLLLSGEKM